MTAGRRAREADRVRRRQRAPRVDVQHIGVDLDLGVAPGEGFGVASVRRRLSAVEQSRRDDEDDPAADPDQAGAALVCRAHRFDHRRRRIAVPTLARRPCRRSPGPRARVPEGTKGERHGHDLSGMVGVVE